MVTPHPTPTDPRFKNIAGMVRGSLTAKFYCGKDRRDSLWACECPAGHITVVVGSSFNRGRYAVCPECSKIKPEMQECQQCGKVLPFNGGHFPTSNQHPFGMRVQCKECVGPVANEYAREWRRELREEVLSHYSGGVPACACCGETVWEFLSLDHIDGGGRQHHREVGGNVLADLKRRGFPVGYRVLCHNCNQCFRLLGYCVHQPPEGVTQHVAPYMKQWRLSPTSVGYSCIHCHRIFPRSDGYFLPHPMMSDGLLNCCRDCHRHNQMQHKRNRTARNRLAAFTHYSGGKPRCACCGIEEMILLTIDHINGGGKQHRKEVPGGDVPAWLVKNKFPDGFRVLCYSCNQARGFYGHCPHDAKRIE